MADGYGWLLGKADAEQVEHAKHLDENTLTTGCVYCKTGEGWPEGYWAPRRERNRFKHGDRLGHDAR